MTKALLVFLCIASVPAFAVERPKFGNRDQGDGYNSRRRRPMNQAPEGCQYNMQCGPGEVCIIPPDQQYGRCIDERSTVSTD